MSKSFSLYISRVSVCILFLFSILFSCSQPEDEIPPQKEEPVEIKVSGIVLNPSSLEMTTGDESLISLSFSPSGATEVPVTWKSDNDDVAKVENGLVTALKSGKATIIASTQDGSITASVTIIVKDRWEAVDLGLGCLWGQVNLGADEPWEYGDYYSFGEVETKSTYVDENYKYGPNDDLTKYYHDRKFILDKEDDAARKFLGDGWRTPSVEEWEQMMDKCKVEEETLNGVNGFRVTGPNGNSIFFPLSGFHQIDKLYQNQAGVYRTNEIYYNVFFNGSPSPRLSEQSNLYYVGVPIRPVKSQEFHSFSIDEQVIKLKVDERVNIPISFTPSQVSSASVDWNSENEDIAMVSCGIVVGISAGSTKIKAFSVDGAFTSECTVEVADWSYPEAESVDLALSIEWASWNLGATKAEEAGDYFAWGEVNHKSCFDKKTYMLYDQSFNLTKYSLDNPILDEIDDAATVLWGNGWRMPTKEEVEELIECCEINRTTQNGVGGYSVVSKWNGNSIFIPKCTSKSRYYAPRSKYIETESGVSLTITPLWTSTYGSHFSSQNPFYFDVHTWPTLAVSEPYWGNIIRPVRSPLAKNVGINIKQLRMESGEVFNHLSPVGKEVTWSSSDESIASVNQDGIITSIKNGEAWIIASTERGGAKDSCHVMVKKWDYPVAKPIDIGLSVKWASWNMGATSEEDPGDHFSWGQTEHVFKCYTYSFPEALKNRYWSSYDPVNLQEEDDVAHVQWGKGWRIPSREDYKELLEKCVSEPATINGVHGMYFTGPNGNRIFLPVLGTMNGEKIMSTEQALYSSRTMSSMLCPVLLFFSTPRYCSIYDYNNTPLGYCVRPVYLE
ncbi:MAG: Ig-like domain-containing protein [Bacteroidales bacterium]|nr:Ig-like domain-containing protein [Bacteroidales bacterium]